MIKSAKFIISNSVKDKIKNGKKHREIFQELCKHDEYSLDQLRSLQQDKLTNIIQYAYKYCEYYKSSFSKAGISPKDIKTIKDLHKVPILTKDDVRNNFEKICSGKRSRLVYKEYTSGTTGTPLKVIRDLYSIKYENAAILRIYKWAGYVKEDAIAYIRGYDTNINYYDIFNKTLYINACNIADMFEEAYNLLEKHNIKIIYCVSSTAEMLSTYIINSGKRSLKLKGIITSSETLSPLVRDKVKKAFQCNIYDYYGNTERVAMVANCNMGEYHLILDYGAEYLKNVVGNYYEIISTNLFNYAMPMINYATGDIVELEESGSKCGMNYPVIKSIIGRESDYLILNGVKVYSTTLTNVFHGIEDSNIIQSQFIQEQNGEIFLNLLLNDKNNFNAVKVIMRNLKKWFNYNNIKILINNPLITNKNGKVHFIVKK